MSELLAYLAGAATPFLLLVLRLLWLWTHGNVSYDTARTTILAQLDLPPDPPVGEHSHPTHPLVDGHPASALDTTGNWEAGTGTVATDVTLAGAEGGAPAGESSARKRRTPGHRAGLVLPPHPYRASVTP